MTSVVPAVIAGLAVGIFLIAYFANHHNPVYTWSDQDIIVYSHTLDEVQAFYARYDEPEPRADITRIGTTTIVYYQAFRSWSITDDAADDYTKELRLTITIDPFGRMTKGLECASSVSYGLAATVESIKTNECLETA